MDKDNQPFHTRFIEHPVYIHCNINSHAKKCYIITKMLFIQLDTTE